MEVQMVIVVAMGNDGTKYYYGPFTNGEHATSWAHHNLKGFKWHWEDLIRPGSTYCTASVSDITDAIQSVTDQRKDCYCTIDGVNWVVEA